MEMTVKRKVMPQVRVNKNAMTMTLTVRKTLTKRTLSATVCHMERMMSTTQMTVGLCKSWPRNKNKVTIPIRVIKKSWNTRQNSKKLMLWSLKPSKP